MNEFSVLIAGKAGDGINQAGLLLTQLFNQLGLRSYMYLDYPSLIRGGHNFAIIRTSEKKVATHKERIDFLLALNQDSVDFHKKRLTKASHVIYDSDKVKSQGIGLPLEKIIKEENAAALMRNSCLIGAFAKSVGIKQSVLEKVIEKHIPKEVQLNLKLALRGYNQAKELIKIKPAKQKPLPIVTGNEAIALGLIQAGLDAYVAYPMTPSSGVLHSLAALASDARLKVIHPENEIAVILMALGFSYTGEKVAVGTSGGGFCLMTEGLSLSAMAELPIVIVISQRAGPSTGIPTYTAQSDLNFVLSAGHGEFLRFVVAPGDAEEAFYWSAVALGIATKFQIPSIILSDKTLSEGGYNLDMSSIKLPIKEQPLLWDRKKPYKRYQNTKDGVSPLTFAADRDAIVKVNSYEHDQYGITTESPEKAILMCDKRLRKEKYLVKALEKLNVVNVAGKVDSAHVLLCWGSNKGVCTELASKLGMRLVQPVVLSPFPIKQLKQALKGAKKITAVENNVTGQLVRLVECSGIKVDKKILKYDGRPFTLEELEKRLKNVL